MPEPSLSLCYFELIRIISRYNGLNPTKPCLLTDQEIQGLALVLYKIRIGLMGGREDGKTRHGGDCNETLWQDW
jgi:hypothetical protein